MLEFAETAKSRFELGTLEDKREILAGLGSNLILSDQKLTISLAKPLDLVNNVAPEVRALHNRLEPTQSEAPQGFWEASYASNENWGRYSYPVRTS